MPPSCPGSSPRCPPASPGSGRSSCSRAGPSKPSVSSDGLPSDWTWPGVGISEAIDDLTCLYLSAGETEPPLAVVRALGEGWASAQGGALLTGSCLDPESGLLDPDKTIADYSEGELHTFLHGEERKVAFAGFNLTYEGLIPKLRKSVFSKERDTMKPTLRAAVEAAATFGPCEACGGTRRNERAREPPRASRPGL